MFDFLPYSQLEKYLPEIIANNVSERARSDGQFVDQYKKYGKDLPEEWKIKRINFIKRHLASYKENPTYRRKLALIAWAYMPE